VSALSTGSSTTALRLQGNGLIIFQGMQDMNAESEADLKDWQEALSIHRALGKRVRRRDGSFVNGATSLAFQQADGDYRYFLGVLNEDRQAKGLPLIEFERLSARG
jgi:hypothetical protein